MLQTQKGEEHVITEITVRKGKTVNYTGTRTVVCKDEINHAINRLMAVKFGFKDTDKIFDLGGSADVYTKNFTKLLNKLDMRSNADGIRSLYSLRHSYITWELERGTTAAGIAANVGTSEEMLSRHYNHVKPSAFAIELSKS